MSDGNVGSEFGVAVEGDRVVILLRGGTIRISMTHWQAHEAAKLLASKAARASFNQKPAPVAPRRSWLARLLNRGG